MKRVILGTFAVIFALTVQAKHVDLQLAQKVGLAYYYEHAGQFVTLEFKTLAVSNTFTETNGSVPVYYIININPKGYIIVSADDNVIPVIGYSYETDFEPGKMPEGLKYWLTQVKKEIVRAINEKISADKNINSQWNYYSTRTNENISIKKAKVVEPLTTATWDQGKYYNQYCPPAAGGPDDKAYVGCVATSMAQIMYYYRYPNTGLGTHGNPAINFGTTTYLWDNMLDNLGNYNEAVALISYHAGISVNMQYAADGSAASTATCTSALENHFRYHSACIYSLKAITSNWDNLLKTNLDAKHPMIYSGSDNGSGGHAWICDGYDASNYYHMNWGWSGYANGYFSTSDLTAGGSYFGTFQGVVSSIYPSSAYPYNCTGTKSVTGITGTIEDGSGPNNYQNNSDCLWLINPAETVTKITLSFISFNTEATNDVVTIYDGNSTSSPVLGTYSGSILPSDISSTGPQMLVRFQTNASTNNTGWKVSYRSTFPSYCSSIITLTSESGTITDGSNADNYSYNHLCRWSIAPPSTASITLYFTEFNIADNDFVKVYNQETNTELVNYTGSTIPSDQTYNTSKILILFKSDGYLNSQGFSLNYTSSEFLGLEENNNLSRLNIFPNPAKAELNIQFNLNEPENINIELITMAGNVVFKEEQNNLHGDYLKTLKTSNLSQGIYLLRIIGNKQSLCKKVIIE